MNTRQQAVVKAIKELSAILPTDGKLEVISHLTLALEAKELQKLSPEALTALKSALPEVPATFEAKSLVSGPTQGGYFGI